MRIKGVSSYFNYLFSESLFILCYIKEFNQLGMEFHKYPRASSKSTQFSKLIQQSSTFRKRGNKIDISPKINTLAFAITFSSNISSSIIHCSIFSPRKHQQIDSTSSDDEEKTSWSAANTQHLELKYERGFGLLFEDPSRCRE